MPHSCWTKRVPLHVSVGRNSTSRLDDSLLFIRLISLVVSIQRNSHHLILCLSIWSSYFLSPGQGGSWVSNIGAEDFVSNDQYTHAGRSWESKVDARVFVKAVSYFMERFIKLFFNLSWINNSLIYLSLIECIFDWGLHFLGKDTLDKLTYWLSIDSMAISYCEEMCSPILSKMRKHQEWILVYLVWIFWWIPSLSCKSKFGHTIVKLLACLARLNCLQSRWCCNLFWDRGTNIMRSWTFLWYINLLVRRISILWMSTSYMQTLLLLWIRDEFWILNCDCIILFNSILFLSLILLFAWGRWLSPPSISLVLLA